LSTPDGSAAPAPRGQVGTPLVFDDPCVVFALRRESQAFRREFRPSQWFKGAPCSARFCGPAWLSVLVVETGVGRAATEQALDWLLGRPLVGNVPYRPKVVLSAGFCGALREGLHTGDVVLATEAVGPEGGQWPTTWPGDLPPGRWDPPLIRGRLLTVDQLAGAPAAKLALGQRSGAVAVDMEGATLARRCNKEGIPFGCVRAVLDEVATPLSPRLVSLLSGGRVSPWRLALALLRAPALTGELWRLGRLARQAGGPLGRALGELLTLTLPWAGEGAENRAE
jgi:adenosylhomocysteine nucleosidase